MATFLASCASAAAPKSSILFVLTDDQDVYMDGASHQPKIRKLIQEEGVTVRNTFASTPVCCPSRGGMLSGRYIHNVPMTNNSLAGNCAGEAWVAGPEKESIGVLMQEQGYMTHYAGKYLNQYGTPRAGGPTRVPPGWDSWLGLVGNSIYYNYTLSNDGVAEAHGDDYATDYLTDLLANRSAAFLRRWAAAAAPPRPFFAIVATPACHGPHEPAPQFAYALTNTSAAPAVRTPNYGPEHAEGKHWLVRTGAAHWRAEPERRAALADWDHVRRPAPWRHHHSAHRRAPRRCQVRRLETLLSVDDLVDKLAGTLRTLGALDDTFIFYVSTAPVEDVSPMLSS